MAAPETADAQPELGPVVLGIRNLSVAFRTSRGRVQALREVSVDVPRGKIVGLVGESGSGKSTLALAVMGLVSGNVEITDGSAMFAGVDLLALSPSELRPLRGRRISMVFQDPMTSLSPVRSIGQQMVDIQYRDREASQPEKRRRAADMLRLVGIPDPERQLKRHSHEFSGGMRQRIAIAMSLMQKPELLICDEPTTALDVTMEAQIVELLRELRKELNTSILFISHDLGIISELCDFVVVLYAGTVVERGSVREIFSNPRHPYTQALFASDPAHIEVGDRQLPTIPGDVPDLVQVPQGCIFEARCSKAFAPCRSQMPREVALSRDHSARCHLLGTVQGG